jgi:tRNA pseudouridine32 synthase/23S rRNA pseudouridine746 synthase
VPDCFIQFQCPVDDWPLPERFTFPFHYTPHPLCVQAAAELRQLLSTQTGWDHNFGHEPEKEGDVYGKMFGVLVVQNSAKKLGYLAAFSGKLAGKSHHPGFVPPVFDLLDEDGFYRKEEAKLNDLNRQIEYLEDGPKLNELLQLLESETAAAALQLEQEKQRLKIAKAERQQRRETAAAWSPEAFQTLETDLTEESKRDHFVLKDLKKRWNQTLHDLQAQVDPLLVEIQALKAQRRTQSAALQQRIFDQYLFLNQHGQQKSLADIFQRNAATPPPSGAGECAAPKLLQYAFLHQTGVHGRILVGRIACGRNPETRPFLPGLPRQMRAYFGAHVAKH